MIIESLFTFFFNELTKYLKQHNCLYVRVDPYLPYQYLNHDGEITGMPVMIGSLIR